MHRRFGVVDLIDVRTLGTADREEAAAAAARDATQYELDVDYRAHAAATAERHEARAETARDGGRSAHDSAERCKATAEELSAKGLDPELVETRMTADVSQARPAADAVKDDGQRSAPKGPTTSQHRAPCRSTTRRPRPLTEIGQRLITRTRSSGSRRRVEACVQGIDNLLTGWTVRRPQIDIG